MIEHEVPPRKSGAERWAEIRRHGKWSFIIRRGIFGAGLIFGTLHLINNYFGFLPDSHWHGVLSEAASFVASALLFGTLMGWWFWRYRERHFTKPAS